MTKNLSTAKKRIRYIIDNEGISRRQFYIKTGIANGVLDQNTGLSEDNIYRFISTYTEINLEWIITGKGPILKKDITSPTTTEKENKCTGALVPYFRSPLNNDLTPIDIDNKDLTPDKYISSPPNFAMTQAFFSVHGFAFYPAIKEGSVIGVKSICKSAHPHPNHKHLVITTNDIFIVELRVSDYENEAFICRTSENEDFALDKKNVRAIYRITCVLNPE